MNPKASFLELLISKALNRMMQQSMEVLASQQKEGDAYNLVSAAW